MRPEPTATYDPSVTLLATEQQDLDTALARLPRLEADMAKLLRRLEMHVALDPGARVLDIGAAQGVCVAALQGAGYDAVGVEPWAEAIKASRAVADATGRRIEVLEGTAAEIPYPDASFDLVHAQSVLEHVPDYRAAFREAWRVLKPGGGFYFYTTSALCPRQNEIRRFPLFPWYPDPLRRRIMDWAVRNRPELVGGTTAPAVHWFTPRRTRAELADAGYGPVLDRWQLKREDELGGWRRSVFRALRDHASLRLAGDVAVPDSAYLAVRT
jgi:ubiquinone/menaquinone biosynthesis C-methylase UbiE